MPKFGYFESVQSYLQRRNAAPSCDLGLPDDRRCQNASRKAKVERAAHASAAPKLDESGNSTQRGMDAATSTPRYGRSQVRR